MHAGVDSKVDVDNNRGDSAERSRVETGEIATMGIDKRGNLGEEGIRDRGQVLHVQGRPRGRGLEQKGQSRCE